MNTPTLTIKNYKSCRGKEGDAFSCTLYVDGKKAAFVEYDGWGGMYMVDWSPSGSRWASPAEKRVSAWVKTLPPIECAWMDEATGKPAMITPNLDMVIEDTITTAEETKKVKRWCKTKTVVKPTDAPTGEYVTWNSLPCAALRLYIAKTYPGAEIINDRFAT